MSCVSQTEPMGAPALTSQSWVQSNVGNKWKRTEGQEGDPGWKQRERGDLGGKWVKRKQKKKEGRQISGKETPGAFLGISVF